MSKPDWQLEHERRLASFPAAIREAHAHSSKHRPEVLGSLTCGCFYCTEIFAPTEISDWVDEDDDGVGQTALCPRCGVDSVLGDRSGFPISGEFMNEMRAFWFGAAKNPSVLSRLSRKLLPRRN